MRGILGDVGVVDSLVSYMAFIACFWLITYVNVQIGIIFSIIWWTMYITLFKYLCKYPSNIFIYLYIYIFILHLFLK